MRFLGISCVSFLLTSIVVINAYYQKKQFYPSVVYITKSNPSMAVLYIQAFIGVWILGKLMRKIFFGQLRSTEFEHLMERSWYAVTETCLAFTVFRDDFTPKFVALFTLLLFLKSFHWLAEDRVDYMERSPIIGFIFHLRILCLLLLLGLLDLLFINYAYQSTVTKGASVQLVFGFEYAILITIVINIGIKYGLHSVDLNSDSPWDDKAVFLLYTELVIGFIKVILYIAFVAITVRIYTLPLFAFRPMYYTIRNFKRAFSDVILSRRAIHNMNTLYPNATPEELAAADNVCIICREEMVTASKKLPCNHIFHTSCLRSWFQRQQTCPTCRLNILRTPTAPTPTNNNNMQAAAAAAQPAGRPAQPPLQPPAPPAAAAAAALNQAAGAPQPQIFNPFAALRPNPARFQAATLFNDAQAAQQQADPSDATTNGQQENGRAGNIPNAATGSQSDGPNLSQPQFIPPFPFAMPFIIPAPIPPTGMANLTEDDLRRLEGNERLNVEARIQCLRNIQTLLDAAVQLMFQYSVATTMPSPDQMTSASSSLHNNNNDGATSANVPDFSNLASNLANFTNNTSSTSANVNFSSPLGGKMRTANTESTLSTTPTPANERFTTNSIFNHTKEKNDVGDEATNRHLDSKNADKLHGEQFGNENDSSSRTPPRTDEEIRKRRLQRFLQHEQQQQE